MLVYMLAGELSTLRLSVKFCALEFESFTSISYRRLLLYGSLRQTKKLFELQNLLFPLPRFCRCLRSWVSSSERYQNLLE